MNLNHSIKYLLLLIPFNTLAHPGHDDIVMQSGVNGFTGIVMGIAVTLAVVSLLRRGKHWLTGKYSAKK